MLNLVSLFQCYSQGKIVLIHLVHAKINWNRGLAAMHLFHYVDNINYKFCSYIPVLHIKKSTDAWEKVIHQIDNMFHFKANRKSIGSSKKTVPGIF